MPRGARCAWNVYWKVCRSRHRGACPPWAALCFSRSTELGAAAPRTGGGWHQSERVGSGTRQKHRTWGCLNLKCNCFKSRFCWSFWVQGQEDVAEATHERALSGSPGPSRAPLPRTSSSCSSPGTPRPLLPAAATSGGGCPRASTQPHPQLWAHSWDARPRPILSSFLPSRPPALSRSPSWVPIVSVPFSVRRRLALPRPLPRTS